MRIGFIGVGNIASAVARGLAAANPPPEHILLSPRNAAKAAALAAGLADTRVMPDNQAVIDESDVVVLAVRPPMAEPVLGPLSFRPDQKVISLIAALPYAPLCALVAPATDVVRAVPLPTVARHIGPVALFPEDAEAVELFGRIGTAVPVADEAQFDALATITATAAPYYAFLGRLADWLVGRGVPEAAAVRYVAAVGHAIAADAAGAETHGFDGLIAEVSTPGGMNEQVLRMFTEADWLAAVDPALDAILARHRGESA